ncbi:exodeoxyribonuclease VII small subunit [Eubacterium xylanophilum]|uniref:exodeoxyribonuclease VII small subunit n=1 Tax=Eubacterium xylanophilum TaxID=39497 RepID=UPI0005533305|nr:exodeoxyribonuclease VII small subunit [Eubacterium xylanophilum]MCR5796337.1 exodeoxyribonuclease VII small subunit [Eubacterium sp.]
MELEQIMEQLTETVGKMENEKMSLEESFEEFSKGMKLVEEAGKAIDTVEKKIKVLMEEAKEDNE